MVTPGVPGTATECGRRVLVVVVHIWYHKNRYVTDVLPLLPLLPPVNSSQGGLQSARFYIGCHLDHIWKVGSVAPIVEIGEPVP